MDNMQELFFKIRERVAKLNVPGIAISIVNDGNVYQDFIGARNLTGDPVDSDTLIEQASVTKGILN
jgi:CubicO group peptidase (beta-lactamase class C family)